LLVLRLFEAQHPRCFVDDVVVIQSSKKSFGYAKHFMNTRTHFLWHQNQSRNDWFRLLSCMGLSDLETP